MSAELIGLGVHNTADPLCVDHSRTGADEPRYDQKVGPQ